MLRKDEAPPSRFRASVALPTIGQRGTGRDQIARTFIAWLSVALICTSCTADVEGARPSQTAEKDGPGLLVHLHDGRRINLRCAGKGSPTVVFEGGFAADSHAWDRVGPQVARLTRVCAYDRAGYGFSDMGPLPRDGAAVAKDLDVALRAARIDPPFILVGHSVGALYARIFADRRPRAVVGMVFVDPAPDHEDIRLAPVGGPGAGSLVGLRERPARCLAWAEEGALPSQDPSLASCLEGSTSLARREDNWLTQISELDTLWGATSDEVVSGGSDYGVMPIVVLTADGTFSGVPDPPRTSLNLLWLHLHEQMAKLSARGSSRLIAHSSHMMIFDRPDAIIQAIQDVVTQARSRAPASP
jgi:pimeloyl-ACP methyl ester carboxylesterase